MSAFARCLAAAFLLVWTTTLGFAADRVIVILDASGSMWAQIDGKPKLEIARESLRAYFEVDRHFIALAALGALADAGTIDRERVGDAIRRYGIDPEKIDPSTV